MTAIQTLSQALIREKEFRPMQELPLADVQPLAGLDFDFLGVRLYWGSVTSLALVGADRLTEPQITGYCNRFTSITAALINHTGTLQISTAFKTTAVRLASYGILCFVFENGCRPDLVAFVQRQKRSNFAKKEYALFWVADASTGRVYSHRWLPFGIFPGRKYLEEVLARQGPGGHAMRAA